MTGKKLNSGVRAALAACVAAGIVGISAWIFKSHPAAPAAPARPDPQQSAYAEAQQTILRNLPDPATARFSDYVTDMNSGAAELGSGIWEAWGKVDFRDAAGANVRKDWHVAWDRKARRIIYWKIGAKETGNYAEALGASKAYPPSPDAAD